MTKPKTKNFNYVSGKKYDGMMGRCYREGDTSYSNYGGRGIRVSRAWIEDINSYREWLEDELSKKGISLDEFISNPQKYIVDRRDTNGHYTPENCHVVSCQENSRNTRKRSRKQVIAADGTVLVI